MGYSRNEVVHPRHYAALDLGTNNCRLMIARRTAQGIHVLDRQNRMVCLGEGLVETGELGAPAMERTLRTLHSYAERLHGLPGLQLRAVATEACRRARNSAAFLSRVRRETGLELEIISPREEVELAVEGCRPLLRGGQGPVRRAIVFDIGGGSTEIAWLRLNPADETHEVVSLVSLPFGVVTLAEISARAGHDGSGRGGDATTGRSSFESMVTMVQEPLHAFEAVHQIGKEIRNGSVQMLGTSGTVTTLASIAQRLTRYSRHAVDGFTLSADSAHKAVEAIRHAHDTGAPSPVGLSQERRHFMLPGCAIFEAIHRVWPVDSLIVADRGLRDGMVARMAAHARDPWQRRHAPSRKPRLERRAADSRGHATHSSSM